MPHSSHSADVASSLDRYDPNYLCTSLIGGRTVMTQNGPVCDIVMTLDEQVRRDSAPYTLSPNLVSGTTQHRALHSSHPSATQGCGSG